MQYCRTRTKSVSTTCMGRGKVEPLSLAPSTLMSLALLAGEMKRKKQSKSDQTGSDMQAVWCPDQQSWYTSPNGDHPKSSHGGAGIFVVIHNQWMILTLSTFLQHLGAGKTKADVPGFDLPNVEDLLWGQVKDRLKNIYSPSHQNFCITS